MQCCSVMRETAKQKGFNVITIHTFHFKSTLFARAGKQPPKTCRTKDLPARRTGSAAGTSCDRQGLGIPGWEHD